jgi:hypothetical protein
MGIKSKKYNIYKYIFLSKKRGRKSMKTYFDFIDSVCVHAESAKATMLCMEKNKSSPQ